MQTIHSIENHFLYHKKWNPEVVEYYVYRILSGISHTLAQIFIPVYMYAELGYSLFEITLFWTMSQVIFVLAIPFSGKVIEKLGVKRSIALHIPFMIVFWYGLRFLQPGFFDNIGLLMLLIFVRAIPKSVKGAAETVFIVKNILNKKNYGAPLAKLSIVVITAALLAPLVGGAIAYFIGFDMLFNAAIVILIISAIPFFLTKDRYFHVEMNPKQIWHFTLHKVSKDFFLAEFGRWFSNSAIWLLWPLFLYIVLANILELGLLVTVSGIVSMSIAHYIGKYVDRSDVKKLLKQSVKIATGMFYFRTLFANPFLIGVTDVVNRLFEPVLIVPYQKFLFKYINSFKDFVDAAVAKNMIVELASLTAFALMAVVFFVLGKLQIPETTPMIFILLFAVFGMPILLMSRITNIDAA